MIFFVQLMHLRLVVFPLRGHWFNAVRCLIKGVQFAVF